MLPEVDRLHYDLSLRELYDHRCILTVSIGAIRIKRIAKIASIRHRSPQFLLPIETCNIIASLSEDHWDLKV